LGQLPVTESVWAPATKREFAKMMNLSKTYRLKALACEKLGRDVPNIDFKHAWADIAIEWHALAARTALEAGATQNPEIR
jgi:hypothetical protein